MTDSDYDKVRDAFSSIMDWASLVRLTISMRSCLPLKFFICTQYVKQLSLIYLIISDDFMAMELTSDLH